MHENPGGPRPPSADTYALDASRYFQGANYWLIKNFHVKLVLAK